MASFNEQSGMNARTEGHNSTHNAVEWEEFVGSLRGLEANDDSICLKIGERKLRIPNGESVRREELEKLIGKRIGVLLTDLPEKKILIRLVSKE